MALAQWVEFFEELQHVRGRSLNTVMAYRRDLELYDEFKEQKTDPLEFFLFLQKKGLSVRSQARVVSSVRTYLRFLQSRGEDVSEINQLRPPKVNAKLPQALTIDEFHRLLDACRVDDPLKSARNHMTLMMLFGLGCRVSELVQADLFDYREAEQVLQLKGKGGKERIVPLTQRLAQELRTYLEHVRPHLVKGEQKSILVNERGHRPSRVDIWRWLAAWSAKAGFEDVVGPHRFRHGCATALLEAGADLRSIQLLLGHASIQTTQIYTSVSFKHLQETVDEHHPLSDIRPNVRIPEV